MSFELNPPCVSNCLQMFIHNIHYIKNDLQHAAVFATSFYLQKIALAILANIACPSVRCQLQ